MIVHPKNMVKDAYMEHKKVPCISLGNQTKFSKPIISKYYDNNKHEYYMSLSHQQTNKIEQL